jgi:hypothetical protein
VGTFHLQPSVEQGNDQEPVSIAKNRRFVDQMKGETIFSKINWISGYHHLWIKEEEFPKTSFNMRLRHYEFIVLPWD